MKKMLGLWNEGGYASGTSVEPGKKIGFHISTGIKKFNLDVYRLGKTTVHMENVRNLRGKLCSPPKESWRKGFRYPEVCELKIGKDWPSGFYYAQFPTLQGPRTLLFLVRPRPAKGTRKGRILYTVGDLTYQAYNSFGGKSIYDYNSTEGKASTHVTYNRPYSPSDALEERWDWRMIPWLEKEGYAVDFCSQIDLVRFPELLGQYKVHLRNGHDEYWTRPEYELVEKWINAGGKLASFSGNTCCTQVRLEDDLRTLICYRKAEKDPITAKSPLDATCCFRDLGRAENRILGAGFHYAGYIGSHGHYPLWEGNGGFEVVRADHWVFKGTGLKKGDKFGFSDSVAGYEVDGCLFKIEGGLPVPTGEDGTPPDFKILGIAKAGGGEPWEAETEGTATLGIRELDNGGMVFNAATTDWAHGLEPDPVWKDMAVPVITRNVLNRFLA